MSNNLKGKKKKGSKNPPGCFFFACEMNNSDGTNEL